MPIVHSHLLLLVVQLSPCVLDFISSSWKMDRLERILSRPVAKPYRSKGIIDKNQIYLNKDGLLDFAPGDIENPKNWSTARRWYITIVSVMLVVNATFASSSPSGSTESISRDLHVSTEAAGLVVTLFLLGYVFGPLLWAPLSEFFGRRWVFYFCFVLTWPSTFCARSHRTLGDC